MSSVIVLASNHNSNHIKETDIMSNYKYPDRFTCDWTLVLSGQEDVVTSVYREKKNPYDCFTNL